MSLPDAEGLSRREYVEALVATGGAAALSACLGVPGRGDPVPEGVDDPGTLPDRQHAWNHVLGTDDGGNDRLPNHHSLSYLALSGGPADDDRETVERALRTLERAYEWSADGLVFTVGYSPAYFDRFEESLPETVDLPEPTAVTGLEDPEFDTDDALVHLASDRPDVLLEAEEALFGERETVNGVAVEARLADVFERTDRRTGFTGPGIPSERQAGVHGIPDSEPVPEESPTLMGFRSGFSANQATEDEVTITEGAFAGATTQHVSRLVLQLDGWYEQDSHYQRVAKLFGPEHAEENLVGDVGEGLGTDPGTAAFADDSVAHADEYGIVGHAQKAARARVDGRPRLLRRDFDSTDDDVASFHFLSLQERIEDFVETRRAMTGADLAGETAVGSRLNNGIMQYLFTQCRGNFLVPPREHRALPAPRPS